MKTLIHAPLLKFALCFLTGLLLGPVIGTWAWGICLLAIPAVGYCLWQDRRYQRQGFERLVAALIYLMAFGLGGLRGWSGDYQVPLTPLGHFNCETISVMGVVTKPVKINAYGQKAPVQIWAVARDSQWVAVQGHALLYAPREQDSLSWAEHDTVLARVQIRDMRSRYPDYLAYLHRQGIYHALYADTLIALGRSQTLTARARAVQTAMARQLAMLIPDSTQQGIALAMFLGEKRGLSQQTRAYFAAAGLSHLLAISGLHVGIIFLLLNVLLAPLHLIRHGQRIKHILILLVLLAYMFITGASPAVVRAVLMFATILLFRIGYQRYHMLNLVAIAALIQMVADPAIVREIGFQLSYSAVLGIVCWLPYMERLFPTENPWLKKIYGWIGVSLVATLATLPLVLIYFGRFPTYFLLANLLVSGLAFPLVLTGFLTVLCAYIPGLNQLLGYLSTQLIDLLHMVAAGIAELPHATLDTWSLSHPAWGYLFLELGLAGAFMLIPRIVGYWMARHKPVPNPSWSESGLS